MSKQNVIVKNSVIQLSSELKRIKESVDKVNT